MRLVCKLGFLEHPDGSGHPSACDLFPLGPSSNLGRDAPRLTLGALPPLGTSVSQPPECIPIQAFLSQVAI